MNCAKCNAELQAASSFCSSCGEKVSTGPGHRKVSVPLAIGIILVPAVFSWFTLRKGYSDKSRVVSICYLVAVLVIAYGGTIKRAVTAHQPPLQAVSQAIPQAIEPLRDETPPIVITPEKLVNSYMENEVGADEKFKGKLVQIEWTVSDIKKDITGTPYITFARNDRLRGVQIYFDDENSALLGSLKKEQRVTVVGRVKGLMMYVIIKDAVLLAH